jgi:hypothetical protein
VLGATLQAATIDLCRKTNNMETNCYDEKDDDCDGRVDSDDTDCKIKWLG